MAKTHKRNRQTAVNGAAVTKSVMPSPANGQAAATAPIQVDWRQAARLILISRALDRVEEERLAPRGLVTYQFSARGHDLAQVLLGLQLDHPHDAATLYYRSRPFVLTAGLTPDEALRSTMGRSGGISEGRDIGVVHNLPARGGATVLPTSGDVGAQYSPAAGWAQAVRYRSGVLGQSEWDGAIAVALGGDGSCATNGFWAALNIVTTNRLPYLFFIEDNGYGISVPGTFQTPGANIAENLASFKNLVIMSGSGTDPETTPGLIAEAVAKVRSGAGPVLLRLTVPRLCGHSFVDTQAYKPAELIECEKADDPLPKLRAYLAAKGIMTAEEWEALEREVDEEIDAVAELAVAAPDPDPAKAKENVFYQPGAPQLTGGIVPEIGEADYAERAKGTLEPAPSGPRMNLIDAVRKTLAQELELNDRVMIFGEDVGLKGGVHGATIDLQKRFGEARVFDTSLNEEGIIGRSVGMAIAGLMPVPEIQFRKYADPAHEQITDCGTIRWRTAGKFAAPMVIRIPVGFGKKTGDPWHSVSGEAIFAHLVGWRIAYPSNAEDAVGLLRTALRGNDPTFFFEHRGLLDTKEGRRPYPGNDFVIPFGKAAKLREGRDLTIVAWGEMVHRALEASAPYEGRIEILDLRTVIPWDREAVLESVRKTGRCLVVHEDNWTCGLGGDIAATVAQEAFTWLDAPVERMATADCPIPYNPGLMDAVVPTVAKITTVIDRLLAF